MSQQQRSRLNQLDRLEKKYSIENLDNLLKQLVEDPEIPIHELSSELRNAVLLALLMDQGRANNSDDICEIIEYLLEMRRAPVIKPLEGKELMEIGEDNELVEDISASIREECFAK